MLSGYMRLLCSMRHWIGTHPHVRSFATLSFCIRTEAIDQMQCNLSTTACLVGLGSCSRRRAVASGYFLFGLASYGADFVRSSVELLVLCYLRFLQDRIQKKKTKGRAHFSGLWDSEYARPKRPMTQRVGGFVDRRLPSPSQPLSLISAHAPSACGSGNQGRVRVRVPRHFPSVPAALSCVPVFVRSCFLVAAP